MQVDLRLGRVVVGVEVVSDFDLAQGINAAQQSKCSGRLESVGHVAKIASRR
jgi:hypothetical protein